MLSHKALTVLTNHEEQHWVGESPKHAKPKAIGESSDANKENSTGQFTQRDKINEVYKVLDKP